MKCLYVLPLALFALFIVPVKLTNPPPVQLNITVPQPLSYTSGTSITITADVWITDPDLEVKQFMTDHADKCKVCVQVTTVEVGDVLSSDAESEEVASDHLDPKYSQLLCDSLESPSLKFSGLPYGRHQLSAYLVYSETDKFSPVSLDFFTTSRRATPPKVTHPESLSILKQQRTLLQFARENPDPYITSDISSVPEPTVCSSSLSSSYPPSTFLMVGVKSSYDSFEYRDAIRNTWGKGSGKGSRYCVFFILGKLDPDMKRDSDDSYNYDSAMKAIRLEQHHNSDLVTNIDVIDSYHTLIPKATKFMSYITSNYDFKYLIMTDDDVYLKVEDLIDGLMGRRDHDEPLYAGQVWEKMYNKKIKPNRDPSHRNGLSIEDYPMTDLPPFAIGPHYILSSNLVNFVGSNADNLKGIGSLEDVSIGYWMLGLGVTVEHLEWFNNARNEGCTENIVSWADLRPHGIYRAYQGDMAGELCKEFERDWVREGVSLSGVGGDSGGDNVFDANVDYQAEHVSVNGDRNDIVVSGNSTFQIELEEKYVGSVACVTVNSNEPQCLVYEGVVEVGPVFAGTYVVDVELEGRSGGCVIDVIGKQEEGELGVEGGLLETAVSSADRDHDRGVLERYQGRKINVGILCISFERHSQNGMFVKLGKHLPRSKFEVTVFGFTGGGGEGGGGGGGEVGDDFVRSFVPVWAVEWGEGGFQAALVELKSAKAWADLKPVLRRKLGVIWNNLAAMDVVLLANSHDDERMFVLLELLRLARVEVEKDGRKITCVMDLPNLTVDTRTVGVDAFVAPSEFVGRTARSNDSGGGGRRRFKVIYPAALDVEGGREGGRTTGGTGNGRKVVGYLGRLASERSPGLFLHVAAKVASVRPDVDFVVAGDGPMRKAMEKMASSLGVRVTFLGSVEQAKVPDFLAGLDCLVNPRTTETFGISNVEARLHSFNVVGWKSWGGGESLGEGRGEMDFDGLVSGVLRVLEKEEAVVAAADAPELILERFGIEAFVNGYASYFIELVGAEGSGAASGAVGNAAFKDEGRSGGIVAKVGTLRIGYSAYAGYIRGVLFEMFPNLYPGANVVVEQLPEPEECDVFVVSVLDGGCGGGWGDACKAELIRYRQTYKNAVIVLVSGEAWDLRDAGALGADMVWGAHTTQEHYGQDVQFVHFPNAATSFAERALTRPSALMRSRSIGGRREKRRGKKKFAAYMYSRCDREERELFFDLLSAKAAEVGEQVDALGACKGGAGAEARRANRFASGWHDDAVEVYSDYAFVIAFENVQLEGYFTEKIVNPYLAGAIPVYWGWEGVGGDVFRKQSFIDCGQGRGGLEACADAVVEAWMGGRWREMAEEEALTEEKWKYWFGGRRLEDEVRRMLWNV